MQLSITNLKIFNNKDFIKLKNLLAKHTKRAYFVGGFVRDTLLKKECFDIDIEIYNIDTYKFNHLMEEIGADGVGKNFFVYKYKNFDIALARTENKCGVGHKAFEVAVCNDEKLGAKRRDFTINSIMINIFTGEILDFYGGQDDLKKGILRVVDEKTFVEDSLRVLRAIQFVARFDLSVDKKSFELMKSINLTDLSKDRISSELIKFFRAKNQALGFRLICDLGVDKLLFGVKFIKVEEEKFVKFIEQKAKFIDDEMFFLYALTNFFKLDKIKTLQRLNLAIRYKRVIKEPFFIKLTDKNLMQIALNISLKNWLGLYSKNRIKKAKELGVYNAKFEPKVDIESILKAGFKGKEIANEIKKVQNLEIIKYLAKKKPKFGKI
ncbi:CCA tRNA nucleotidyltransferase [Campylobacter geochelonis]|uniref:CCA tRNA nucleotidyltransferase n=1 Tax=Campylobacter geochelonis TaxID=1780362 RepID=UPI000770A9D7|nr:CCA tRNA nucleotidyltransferase [Campylobacter geochelonis]CZE48318.1 polyA polymerase family protein [Campylobacter geochelonis]